MTHAKSNHKPLPADLAPIWQRSTQPVGPYDITVTLDLEGVTGDGYVNALQAALEALGAGGGLVGRVAFHSYCHVAPAEGPVAMFHLPSEERVDHLA